MIAIAIIAGVLLAFVGVLLVRTWRFAPKADTPISEDPVTVDETRVIDALRTLVRFRTVSRHDPSEEEDEEFEKLIAALPTLYPRVFATCAFERMPDRGLLFTWHGQTAGDPSVLMAHYDVVPADESQWEKPPFEAILEDGVVWGRGTLDTKVTINGVLSAAEQLIGEGFVPQHDVYFAFSGNEETNGSGALRIVEYFEQHGITPSMVVDEGGAVVENVFPGVTAPCGMIGIAEKGIMDVRFTTHSGGGHASAPKPHTPVGVLSRACTRVEARPMKAKLTAPVAAMFDTLGRHSSFVYRMIFANLWCFRPVLDGICKASGGELNALMRTTVAFTQMKGSEASNVIPPVASMVANIRINPKDDIQSVLAYLKDTVADETVSVELIHGNEPSRISTVDGDGYARVAKAVASTWKGTIVSPYLMVQCSDSRHYGRISDKVYRFSAMDLTSEERATIHGNNERIRVDCACRAVELYIRLMKDC